MLLNMVSFELHHKEGLDLALTNMSLLSEVTLKAEDKVNDRVTQLKNRIMNLNEVLSMHLFSVSTRRYKRLNTFNRYQWH